MTPDRVNILGVGVSPVDIRGAVELIEGWIQRREAQYVCVRDVHGVMESQRDERLRVIHNRAGMVTPDGMPLVWLCRLSGREGVDRVYGPDLMLALWEVSAAKGYRHYLYGGAQGVPEKVAANLGLRFPGSVVCGLHSPPYRPLTREEDEAIVATINDARPDIVWVGLGTPKQEHWMAAHVKSIAGAVLIGVGAAFDFHAGVKRQAPRWIQRSGFEWLFRLATEPRRLWRRYLVNNPLFVALVLLQGLRIKRYRLT